jgi:hypothetical protein
MRIRPNLSSRLFPGMMLWLVLAPPSWGSELAALLERTAVEPPAKVSFREERHNPMFREPMVLTGYLEYLDDGVLRKVIETPFVEDVRVEQERVIVTRDGKTRTLSLNRSRALRVTLGAIEAVLAGDEEKLAESFRWDLAGSDDSWIVKMSPLSDSVSKRISGLEITGTRQAIVGIRMELPDGEWHDMKIGDSADPASNELAGAPQ